MQSYQPSCILISAAIDAFCVNLTIILKCTVTIFSLSTCTANSIWEIRTHCPSISSWIKNFNRNNAMFWKELLLPLSTNFRISTFWQKGKIKHRLELKLHKINLNISSLHISSLWTKLHSPLEWSHIYLWMCIICWQKYCYSQPTTVIDKLLIIEV